MSFAKAMLRLQEDEAPAQINRHRMVLAALRFLHEALKGKSYDPCLALPDHFKAAANAARGRNTAATAYRIGCELARTVAFINKYNVGVVRIDWRNPNPKPSDHERIGAVAERNRDKKLPSPAALDALPKIALMLTDDPDVLRMACVKLLHCAPWRINEVLTLPFDCEVEEPCYENGEPVRDHTGQQIMRYGLRYIGEKGFGPAIKWIPTAIIDVAKQAIRDIRRITAPVRRDAAFMRDNAGYVNVPGLSGGDPDELLKLSDLARMLDPKMSNKVHWCRVRKIPLHRKQGDNNNCYARRSDVCAAIRAARTKVKRDFPLRFEDHLLLVRENSFHRTRCETLGSAQLLTYGAIADFLCGHGDKISIFDRLGFRERDGSPIKMTTHQLRHWLNTLAQEGGMKQELIARWSGRKDLGQNAAYDHLTGRELAERLREMVDQGKIQGDLIHAADRLDPVERSKFLGEEIAAAHVTELGICIHDWALTPCETHGDCSPCDEHLIDKGNAAQREEAEQQLREIERMIAIAEREANDGTYGAPEWLAAHRKRAEALKKVISAHEAIDPPAGTLIHLGQNERR